jgi:hypothetical protein
VRGGRLLAQYEDYHEDANGDVGNSKASCNGEFLEIWPRNAVQHDEDEEGDECTEVPPGDQYSGKETGSYDW